MDLVDPSTNLSDLTADRVRLWNPEERRHESTDDRYLARRNVRQTKTVEIPIGQGEVEERIVFEDPQSDLDVPGLNSLLAYLDSLSLGGGGEVHKHISNYRRYLFAPPLDVHKHRVPRRDAPLRKAVATTPENFVNLRTSKHVSRATLLDTHEHSWNAKRNVRKTIVFIDNTIHVWVKK